MSQESNLRDQYNNSLDNMEIELKQKEVLTDLTQKESNHIMAQYKALLVEKNQMMADLDKAQMGQKEAEENSQK